MLGQRQLVTGSHRHRGRDVPAAGDVQDVNAGLHQLAAESGGLLAGDAALGPVRGRQADVEHRLRPDGLAHGPHHLEREALPVLHASAVGVGALVGQGGAELVDEVAVGAVDLDDVVAGLDGAPRGRREGLHDPTDPGLVQLAGNRMLGEGDRAGGQQLPALQGAAARALHLGAPRRGPRLASAVPDLDTRQSLAGVNRLHQAALAGDLLIRPQPQVVGGQAPLRGDRRGLHDDRAETAHRAAGVVNHVPVGDDAVLRFDRVHAHRRQPQAVAGGQPAHGHWLKNA